jgi:hypothetical protein
MKIKLKARRISGNDPVTFRNPHGDPIVLEKIGDVSQELENEFAYKLCSANADILEIAAYEVKFAASPINKMAQAHQRALADLAVDAEKA